MVDGVTTASICKGRREKKELTKRNNKVLVQLKSNFIRYYEVLDKLGFRFDIGFNSIFDNKNNHFQEIVSETGEKKELKWIGIAPFATHRGKIYPLELQEKVIAHFAKDNRIKVFIFGGGKEEKDIVTAWCETYPTVKSMIGKLNLSQELTLMSQLDLMYSMDSANMHLASLVNTTVLSLWGATHPYSGFMGWNQSIENTIQVDLLCRPCSIYGQKSCYRKDYACLSQITPEQIINRIEKILF